MISSYTSDLAIVGVYDKMFPHDVKYMQVKELFGAEQGTKMSVGLISSHNCMNWLQNKPFILNMLNIQLFCVEGNM